MQQTPNEKSPVKTNSLRAWILAARPKTLSGAAVPVLIGTAFALHDAGREYFQGIPAILCFLFAFVMQIDANFVNDYFDFKHGNDDVATRLGPKRACAEGWITPRCMRMAIAYTTLAGCLIGLPLAIYGGLEMVLVGMVCVLFCFLYSTRLSYLGLGDFLVLVFFGIIPVSLTYYLELPIALSKITPGVFVASLACGLAIDTLLIVNNYRDRDNDLRDGKMTLVVKIGARNAEWLYLAAGYTAALLMLTAIYLQTGHIPTAIPFLLMAAYASIHTLTYLRMKHIHQGRELNQILGATARNILIYGLACTAAILIP